jgi:hypothetical protein
MCSMAVDANGIHRVVGERARFSLNVSGPGSMAAHSVSDRKEGHADFGCAHLCLQIGGGSTGNELEMH